MHIHDYESYRYTDTLIASHAGRWASEEELEKQLYHLRLTGSGEAMAGLPVISDGNDMYVDASDSHNLIIGSTGSKKTRLFAMPMLETIRRAGESVFISDPKGELYDLTAQHFEDAGYKVYTVNLREPSRSDCWNPLYLMRKYYDAGDKDRAATIMNDLAMTLMPDGKTNDRFWTDTSRALLCGMVMMMVENRKLFPEETVTLAMLRALSNNINENGMPGVTVRLAQTYPEDSLARNNLAAATRGSEKTFDNVCVSYDSSMQGMYIQNDLIAMMAGNDVDFSLLGERKTALFLIMPDERTTLHSIVSMMIKQCYEHLIDNAQHYKGGKLPVRVNFLLDEFSNLPKIPDMSSMISAARSRNVRFHLIVQGLYQLESKYGHEDASTIKGNCGNWVFLTSRELPLLQEISELCGHDANNMPLITPTQLQRLDKDNGEVLMLLGRNYPFIAHLPDISEYCTCREPGEPRPKPQKRKNKVVIYDEEKLDSMYKSILREEGSTGGRSILDEDILEELMSYSDSLDDEDDIGTDTDKVPAFLRRAKRRKS